MLNMINNIILHPEWQVVESSSTALGLYKYLSLTQFFPEIRN